MVGIKRYLILESLPTYGPMYISVTKNDEPFYSEGLVVCLYKSDGTNWVANFQLGWTDLNEIFELSNNTNLFIIAGGTCYIMDPDQIKPIAVFGVDYANILTTHDGRIILQGQTDLTIIETNGEYWHTERISWDGLKDLQLENNIVSGLSYDPINDADEWVNFTYNIDSEILTGGSYQNHYIIKKPWWKIW